MSIRTILPFLAALTLTPAVAFAGEGWVPAQPDNTPSNVDHSTAAGWNNSLQTANDGPGASDYTPPQTGQQQTVAPQGQSDGSASPHVPYTPPMSSGSSGSAGPSCQGCAY